MDLSESNGSASPANWARKIAGPFMVFIAVNPSQAALVILGYLCRAGSVKRRGGTEAAPDELGATRALTHGRRSRELKLKPVANVVDEEKVEVVIVGGGPAGLSAALVLGRSRRRVVLCDAGSPRNWAAREMHGFLGRDCTDPADLRKTAREQLARYQKVQLRDVSVIDAKA